jgi:hypothetical protein
MSLRTVSWVFLAVIGFAVLLLSLVSANLAYRADFPIAGVSLTEVAAGRDAVAQGLRGARGTAAGWGAAWATLFLVVVFGPYRRGDVGTWWGILFSVIVLGMVVGARMLLPRAEAGIGTAVVLLVLVLIGLLLDVKRLTGAR